MAKQAGLPSFAAVAKDAGFIPVLPPVVADYWRRKLGHVIGDAGNSAWTTVAHWYGYDEFEWRGRRYAGKRESLIAPGWGAVAPADGMLAFHDVHDCASAIRSTEEDYDRQSRAAQSLAETTFSRRMC